MERRTALRLLSSALLTGALGRAASAAAQTAGRPPATKWVPADGAPAVTGVAAGANAPGVTAKET